MQVWGLKFASWGGHSQGCLVILGISLAVPLPLLTDLLVYLSPEYAIDCFLESRAHQSGSSPHGFVLSAICLYALPLPKPSGPQTGKQWAVLVQILSLGGRFLGMAFIEEYNCSPCHSNIQQEVFGSGPPALWLTRIPILVPIMFPIVPTLAWGRGLDICCPTRHSVICRWSFWSAGHGQKGWLFVFALLSAFRTARLSWRPSFSYTIFFFFFFAF